MRLTKLIIFGITLFVCGDVFAVSGYATTIQQNLLQGKSFLSVASFPTTESDATFVTRMVSKAEGYRPFFDRSAFTDLSVVEQDEIETMLNNAEKDRLNMLNNATLTEYCESYPDDDENCDQSVSYGSAIVITDDDDNDSEIYPNMPPPNNIDYGLYMNAALTPGNVAKYNLKDYNGGCTPPERTKWGVNKILTSGQYAKSAPAFEKFMITAFRKEGGCGPDVDGWSCYGCYSKGLCSGVDMRTVTRAKVENLAYKKIYKQYNVHSLPDAFRGYALWGMWGSGSVVGIKLFQGALNTPKTGKIDSETIQAAENYKGDFADVYTRAHEQFYRNIVKRDPRKKVYLRGWLNSLQVLKPSGCHVVPQNPIYR